MTVIDLRRLAKTFVSREKQPGLAGRIRALVRPVHSETRAVRSVTFSVRSGA